jgi:hypothetical protein
MRIGAIALQEHSTAEDASACAPGCLDQNATATVLDFKGFQVYSSVDHCKCCSYFNAQLLLLLLLLLFRRLPAVVRCWRRPTAGRLNIHRITNQSTY